MRSSRAESEGALRGERTIQEKLIRRLTGICKGYDTGDDSIVQNDLG